MLVHVRRMNGIRLDMRRGSLTAFLRLTLADKVEWVKAACDYISTRKDASLQGATDTFKRARLGLPFNAPLMQQLLRMLPFMADLARAVQQVSASCVASASPTFVARPSVLCRTVQRVRDNPEFSTSLSAHLVVFAYFLEISHSQRETTSIIESARSCPVLGTVFATASVSARCHPSPSDTRRRHGTESCVWPRTAG